MSSPSKLTIASRFRGPPESGNGGYTCGVVAGVLGGTVRVTLRSPPPLDTPLEVRESDAGVTLHWLSEDQGDVLVAEATPDTLSAEAPEQVPFDEAIEAAARYIGFKRHPFPTCFVCGPERAEGDGLRIFPGEVIGRELVAAPWIPADSLAGEDGNVRPEVLWASLDCPSYFGYANMAEPRTALLGRMTCTIAQPLRVGEQAVALGWLREIDGRKLYAGSAIYAGGEVIARADATWIALHAPAA